MKKYLLSFAVLAMSMAMFNSCSKDKEEAEPELPAIMAEAALENVTIIDGESITIAPTYNFVDEKTTYEWSINGKVIGTEPALRNYKPEGDGEYTIVLRVTSTAGTSRKEFKVTVKENLQIVDFEGGYWSKLIDSEQYNGSLLYGDKAKEYAWTDETTQLSGGLTLAWGGEGGFSEGGTAISNYIDSDVEEHATFEYQLAVPETNGSKNFAVVYCNATIKFPEGVSHIIKSMDISHTTYELGVVANGNDYAVSLKEKGFLTLTITADNGKAVNVDMVRDKKILPNWTKVDLSMLGAVNSLSFSMTGSDSSEWDGVTYLNTPAYFAFDNVVVKF